MPRRRERDKRLAGRYCGLSIKVWRATVLTVRASHWYVFSMLGGPDTPAAERHAAVVSAATLLLPVSWHSAHKGRLSPDFYQHRRAMLALWSPRLPGGQVSG